MCRRKVYLLTDARHMRLKVWIMSSGTVGLRRGLDALLLLSPRYASQGPRVTEKLKVPHDPLLLFIQAHQSPVTIRRLTNRSSDKENQVGVRRDRLAWGVQHFEHVGYANQTISWAQFYKELKAGFLSFSWCLAGAENWSMPHIGHSD